MSAPVSGQECTALQVIAGHDLSGKEAIVTGGTSGLGYQTALALATAVWAAVAPELDGVGGQYLEDCAAAVPWAGPGELPRGHYLPYAMDPANAGRLWVLSGQLLDHLQGSQ